MEGIMPTRKKTAKQATPAKAPAAKKSAAKKAPAPKKAAKKTAAAPAPAAPAGAAAESPLCRIKVVLKGTEPQVWRRFTLPHDVRLDRLNDVIQASLAWQQERSWRFQIAGDTYLSEPDLFDQGESLMAVKFRLNALVPKAGNSFLYTYDLIEEWDHEVTLEKILPAGARQAVLEDGGNAAPPEDCGGLQGYYQLLETLADPEHEDHEEMLEFAGGPINPAEFRKPAAAARVARAKV